MKKWGNILRIGAVLCGTMGPAQAHNFDEYLQTTQLSLSGAQIDGAIQLHPGNGVADRILAEIDTDGDRQHTPAEVEAYARRVLGDVTLSVDGTAVIPRLLSHEASTFAEIEDALGTIRITFAADLPQEGVRHTLAFENRHLPELSVYVATATAGDFRVSNLESNATQSSLRLDYEAGSGGGHDVDFGNFAAMFHLGLSHIAEGTDHLLFLLALLLPASLIAVNGRWAEAASARRSTMQILKIVTAFTLGHSLTLALASLGIVVVPSQPIEILIAVSILISAVHAARPLFPGWEAAVAAFFGLIHGLAFATTINLMAVTTGERAAGLLGFNLGIEAMQLLVVAAVMPSLYLFSRTPAYPFVRMAGAVFAGVAACGWIAERLFGTSNVIEALVQAVADQAPWLALVLFAASVIAVRSKARSG